MPARAKDRRAVLEYKVAGFATLWRDLIDAGLLHRENGVYRRP